jgi:septum site-determining protein MinC
MASILSETSAAFELKGEMSMFSVLRLMDPSLQRVESELTHQVSKAPAFFQDMPVVIDLAPLADASECPDFGSLRELLNQHGLVTLGVRNGTPHQQAAPVSPGSELLADGCIHVYGPLRGRALAGVNGDTSARIFCQKLEAELVAIAGRYRTSEDLDPNLKGRPVQIRLEGDRLTVSPM